MTRHHSSFIHDTPVQYTVYTVSNERPPLLQVCQVATVVMETVKLVLSQFKKLFNAVK